MIDYHGHVATLQVIQDALDASVGGSPHAATWLATKGAIAAEPGCALLGTLLDHLFERSQRAQPEQALLEEGAALFKKAANILTKIASLRKQFEDMIDKPATATTDKVDATKGELEGIQPLLTDLAAQFEGYRVRALPPFRHVAGHAIARDQSVAGWLWRDVVLSRRTDAFIRALQAAGDGSPATTAFAFGALAGYAANAVGSSFISHAVGGPRRSHPIRDRVARYAVGAWLKINEPALCSSLSQLRDNLTLGDPQAPALPAAIHSQIATALATTYPAGAPASMPNLDEGYATLLHHLDLLESFPRLVPVRDILPALVVRIMKSKEALKALIKPADWPPFIDPPGEPPVPPGPPNPGNPSPGDHRTSDGGCGVVIFSLALIISITGLIIYHLATGRFPWETAAQGDPPPGSSAAALKAFVQSDDALVMVADFYTLHNSLYDAVSAGVGYLKQIGVLYPDELDLSELTFSQFTRLVTPGPNTVHPHRPLPDPDIGYKTFPPTPIEERGTHPSRYPEGATPDVFLREGLAPHEATAGGRGVELWLSHQDAPPGEDGVNLNLDADRGFDDRCWRVAPGHSITENPVPVKVLAYGDVE